MFCPHSSWCHRGILKGIKNQASQRDFTGSTAPVVAVIDGYRNRLLIGLWWILPSPRRLVSAPTLSGLMNGISFMQGWRTDLKGPVWSPSANGQGKIRARGPLYFCYTLRNGMITFHGNTVSTLFSHGCNDKYLPLFMRVTEKNFLQTWWQADTEVHNLLLPFDPREKEVKLREYFLWGTPVMWWERSGWISDKTIEKGAAMFVI